MIFIQLPLTQLPFMSDDLNFALRSHQVVEWRRMMVLDHEDMSKVYVDSWGMKRCFTHLLRRWLSGTVSPRASFRQ
jgi:hypothetical protein